MHSVPKRKQDPAPTRDDRGRSRAPERIPSWDDIRFFLAIQRAGSLSKAARPLGVTQPTCGRRLLALETALGLRLFERTPDGLEITSDGRTLLEAATRMERGASDLALRATLRDRDLEGVVRIATTELFACSFVVGALQHTRERYPDICVELVLSNAEADLFRREAEIAIRFGRYGSRPSPPALVARKLGDEPFCLYGAEAYVQRRGAPANPNDLSEHEVVVTTGPHPAREWCSQAFARSTLALSAPSMQVSGAAIAAGVGLGVLPKRAARLFPGLRALSPAVAHGTGWLCVHPDLRRLPRVRAVVDTLVALYRADRVLA